MVAKLIVVDSGLSAKAGHHAALLENFAELCKKGDLQVDIYGHKSLSKELKVDAQELSLKLVPFFETEHYGYYAEQADFRWQQAAIKKLCYEYVTLLQATQGKDVHYLFHSQDWIHLWALSLALRISKTFHAQKIIVLLLYHPLSERVLGIAGRTAPQYTAALRSLQRWSKLQLFAADYEIEQCVKSLVGPGQIGLHPCLLPMVPVKVVAKKKKQVLLYAGDAKEDKGFLELPAILDALCTGQENQKYSYVIHYTHVGQNPAFHEVEKYIVNLSKIRPELQVINGFIETKQLQALFAESHCVLLNYCPNIYQYKSSGLAWLAAVCRTCVISFHSSWLTRELQRLGSGVVITDRENMARVIENITDRPQKVTDYHDKIFQSFDDWLLEKLRI